MKIKKIKSNILIIACLFLLTLLILASCSGEQEKLHSYIQNLKQTVAKKYNKKPIAPLKLENPIATTYVSKKGKSPFSIETVGSNKVSSPLLIYPISMLKFVGIVRENDQFIAYVIAPNTKLYSIRVGDEIGIHKGTVQAISNDQMVILEQNPEVTDKGATQLVTLRLREEP